MAFALTWIAAVLRDAGLEIVEEGPWQTRGLAEMGEVAGVICHHTGGPLSGTNPSLSTVLHGRSDLPGPLSHLYLSRDGTFHVLAAGRCNHAGAGIWQGISTGNSRFIGIEAENAGDGKDPWPLVQMDAYARGVAAILSHIGVTESMCCGHKEYALPKGRKIDPSFDMAIFRTKVSDFMRARPIVVPAAAPHEAMLRLGDRGDSVRDLQRALKTGVVDGDFGPNTEEAVRAFQAAHGLTADGLVGPQTWKALGYV